MRYSTKSSWSLLAGPLHVLEHEDGGVDVGEPLEEEPPGSEQVVSFVRHLLIRDREEVSEHRLHEPPLACVEHVLVESRLQLPARGRVVVVLGDASAHANHVREGPVGHSLAVSKAAAAVPVDRVDQSVEVLVELPHGNPRLPDPADAHGRDEVRPPLVGGCMEELLDAGGARDRDPRTVARARST